LVHVANVLKAAKRFSSDSYYIAVNALQLLMGEREGVN